MYQKQKQKKGAFVGTTDIKAMSVAAVVIIVIIMSSLNVLQAQPVSPHVEKKGSKEEKSIK